MTRHVLSRIRTACTPRGGERLALVLGLARALAPPPASSARSAGAGRAAARRGALADGRAPALRRGRCYAFAAPSGPSRMKLAAGKLSSSGATRSPEPSNRLVTGPLERFERMVRGSPAYAPLVGCSRWEFVGALPISERRYLVRVRVSPPYGSSAPYAAAWPRAVDY